MHVSKQKVTCDKCHSLISKPNYEKHNKVCGVIKIKSPRKIPHIDYDPNIGFKDGTRVIWNKGLTKDTHPSVGINLPNKCGANNFFYGKNHSQESKNKISIKRRQYLIDNPDQVPYKLNHSSVQSYPEKYFETIFLKRNLIFEKEYQVSLYSLDFAFIDQKIDLEIDGDQHYLDQKIVDSDVKRTKYLNELGWRTIRVKWSDFQKLSLDKKIQFIDDLLNQIFSHGFKELKND